MDRRKFITLAGGGIAGVALTGCKGASDSTRSTEASPEVIVVGSGVFGLWTAYHLRRKGIDVTLVDTYGAGNTLGSSGGHTRMIQVDSDTPTYIRSAIESFAWWERLEESSYAKVLYQAGRLRVGSNPADMERAIMRRDNLRQFGVTDTEILEPEEVRHRWPQFRTDDMIYGSFNPGGPGGSALRSDVAGKALGAEFEKMGGKVRIGHADWVVSGSRLESIRLRETGEQLKAQHYVFACGPWMPALFPELFKDVLRLEARIVYFFGAPAGDESLSYPRMPAWSIPESLVYGYPDVEGYGFKVAPSYEPGSVADIEGQMRKLTYHRFPALEGMPIKNARGCQLCKTVDFAFIVDNHPEIDNALLVGAGSGHGFKHGPTVGEHASRLILGEEVDEEYAGMFRFKNQKFDPEEAENFDDL